MSLDSPERPAGVPPRPPADERPWSAWWALVIAFGALVVAGFGLAALVRHHRLRWVAYVDTASLTIVNGNRRTVLPWEEVAGVGYGASRLVIRGTAGHRSCALWVDRTVEAHEAPTGKPFTCNTCGATCQTIACPCPVSNGLASCYC